MIPILGLLHIAATWALVGLIWTIQLVHYPLFRSVEPSRFIEFHRFHSSRIGLIVAPLMLLESASGLILWWAQARPNGFGLSLLLLPIPWLSTALLQVPLHRQLSQGYDEKAVHRLIATNWIRTAAWTARGLILVQAWLPGLSHRLLH